MDTIQKSTKNTCILQSTQKRWKNLLDEEGILYLYAMTGFGKTTQTLLFANAQYKEWERLSASEEQFFNQLENVIGKYEKIRVKTLLILDDLQWILEADKRQRLFELILELRKNKKIHLFFISRAAVPAYLNPFQVTRQMAVENQEALRFDENDTRELLQTYPALAAMPVAWQEKMISFCLELAKGYPLGMNAFFQRLLKNPEDARTAATLAVQDMYDYLDIHLFGEWTSVRREAVISLSVYEQFDRKMAEVLLGERAGQILKDFLEVGSFIRFKAPDTYWFAPFFQRFLRNQLKKRPREEWILLYEAAGSCYEEQRNYEQALRCYKQAGCQKKIVELVVYLSENAEGCAFARIAQEYISELSNEWEQREPRILGAKAMLAAYRMEPQECLKHLARLKEMADEERKCMMERGAVTAYVRTAIACPYDTADKLKDNMLYFLDYVKQNGFHLNNIMPTGNMPSLINGGLDLLPWEKNKKLLYPVIKAAAELIMGKEAVGIADASMGEILYEQNQSSKAMAYLTKALSSANHNGSIRVQYAVTAVMARLFQSEGQADTSDEILHNLYKKVEEERFNELLPNLHASFAYCALLKQDMQSMEEWLKQDAPDEHATFYITARFQLLTKARVYVAIGKPMEALYILNLLDEFATLYERTYLHIEILVLNAIVFFRRGEPWKETLLTAVEAAEPYGLVRVFADQGAALMPLWKQIDWEAEEKVPAKLKIITKGMKQMAGFYPGYLKGKCQYGELSKKEKQVLRLMADGLSNSQIAQNLSVNLGTAKFHVANIMKKLEAENRTVAVRTAQEEGLL